MAFFGLFKGEASYKRNVNIHKNSTLKNRECKIDERTGEGICNGDGKLIKQKIEDNSVQLTPVCYRMLNLRL